MSGFGDPPTWMHSTREEDWNSPEEYPTREAAIADAPSWHALKPGARFFVGRKVPFSGSCRGCWGESIVEQLSANGYDFAPCDAAEEWPDATKAQVAELDEQIGRVIDAWIDRHGLYPTFYSIDDVTVHSAPEVDDPDATQVIEPPGLLLDQLDGTGPEATAGEAFGSGQ